MFLLVTRKCENYKFLTGLPGVPIFPWSSYSFEVIDELKPLSVLVTGGESVVNDDVFGRVIDAMYGGSVG